MTKTYHDVEAVTRLLEEKEKDLELAAKIGQELLERNKGRVPTVPYLPTQVQSHEFSRALRQIFKRTVYDRGQETLGTYIPTVPVPSFGI